MEAPIDPNRAIVDAHHHLWEYPGSVYRAPELLADLTGSHNVVRTVFVECLSKYDQERAEHLRPVGETEFVRSEATALATAAGEGGPRLGAIVGHALATLIAIAGGSVLSKYVSEKTVGYVGGVLFLLFALLTALGLY